LQRVAVYGKVTLDGAPLTSGSISLVPAPSTEGPVANGLISQGTYRFDRSDGPVAGDYQVLVVQAAGESAEGKAESFGKPAPRRREWQLQVKIPAAQDFEHSIVLP
jgi:hypothetical protein